MAYLPKLNPTVGGGLGGLPEVSGGAVRNEPFSPLHIVNRGETASIAAGNVANHTFGFTVKDPAKCLIRVQAYTSYGGMDSTPQCPLAIGQVLNQQLYQDITKYIIFKLLNDTTIDIITNNSDYPIFIEVIEYDFEYESLEFIDLPTVTDGATQALPTSINDPINTIFFLGTKTTGTVADGIQVRGRVVDYSLTLKHVTYQSGNTAPGSSIRLEDKDTIRVWSWSTIHRLYIMHLGA